LAFGPNLPATAQAPAVGPNSPRPRGWWALYARPAPPRPLDEAEAQLWMNYFQIIALQWPGRYQEAQHIVAWAGPAGLSPVGGIMPVAVTSAFIFRFPSNLLLREVQRDNDPGPPAALVLAVRAARRAVAASPDDPDSYMALAQACTRLWEYQEKHWAGNSQEAQEAPFPGLHKLRQVETMTALKHALLLQPEAPEVHLALAQTYGQMYEKDLGSGVPQTFFTHLDLALEELRTAIQEIKDAGPLPGETREQFDQRLERLEKEEDTRSKRVKKALVEYELRAKNDPPLAKAQQAYRQGLAGEALKVLMEEGTENPSPAEAAVKADMEIDLLALAGRGEEVLDQGGLPPGNMHHFRIEAALGNYDLADQDLEQLLQGNEIVSTRGLLFLLRGQTFETILSPRSLIDMNQVVASVQARADLLTLRGTLALERGKTAQAAANFQQALDLVLPRSRTLSLMAWFGTSSPLAAVDTILATFPNLGPWFLFQTRPLAAHYLNLLREEKGRRQ
ncbi:MAG: hypothetical protein JO112_15515, partial [Planctomycetes bacterium]|nr:hypothetical protein [Planctomycetota bacterium]